VGVLQETLWHQGTVYAHTAPAVPGIAEAALGDTVGREDRIWLVLLLAWIAAGTGRSADVRASRDAVRAWLPDLLTRLEREDDEGTQLALADLAAQFPEAADESHPLLRGLVEREPSDPRRLALELALAALGGDADCEALLSRLPDDYYDEEDVAELRARLTDATETREVYREILDDIVGAAIDI
jgi:hypothetical protein